MNKVSKSDSDKGINPGGCGVAIPRFWDGDHGGRRGIVGVVKTMFPLSCVSVCVHTGHEISAHKKTWSAHKWFLQIFHTTPNSDEGR